MPEGINMHIYSFCFQNYALQLSIVSVLIMLCFGWCNQQAALMGLFVNT